MNAGSVNVNNVVMNVFQFPVPMGGWSQSGIGPRMGGAWRCYLIGSARSKPSSQIPESLKRKSTQRG
jgi:acyl-CoA reductase-like NAD-dependent aldehyde dehydrogenase